MKLHEEFKLYENMWDNTQELTETSDSPIFDETELDACLNRINANSDYSPDYDVSVKLSKDDLKKALKIGTTISHGFNGMTIPAQIIDSAELVFMYDDGSAWVNVMLHGDTRKESGLDANEYLDNCLPIIDSTEFDMTFKSEEEAFEYFKQEILPVADEVVHKIIQQAWTTGGFNDYSGITDYEYSGLHEDVDDSTSTICSCDLEKTIDHMENMGRLPRLPYGWFIDDIDETDDDSRIMFSHRRLPLGICFYGKYYMGSTYDHCKYEFSYYINIDGTEFDHTTETCGPDPEGFISRIF
jgi:hypothetical protein